MDDAALGNHLFTQFCRHIVGLSWLDQLIKPKSDVGSMKERFQLEAFVVSAFVVCVRDIWFLVTAGHIITRLEQKKKEAGRRITKSRLIDALAPGPDFPPIPFTLGDTPQWCIDEKGGNDYALIPLSASFVAQLAAGGICPLTEEAWTGIPEQADAYFVVGFPNQATRVEITEQGTFGSVTADICTPPIQVEAHVAPPEDAEPTVDRFYAKVPEISGTIDGREVTLDDLDGASGGPVFAATQFENGQVRYWLVGVQSSWWRRSRILAACYTKPLIDALTESLDRHADQLDQLREGGS